MLRFTIACFWLILMPVLTYAQDGNLDFEECNRSGKCNTLPDGFYHNVDISSRINITVDQGEVSYALNRQFPHPKTDQLFAEIEEYAQVVTALNSSLETFQQKNNQLMAALDAQTIDASGYRAGYAQAISAVYLTVQGVWSNLEPGSLLYNNLEAGFQRQKSFADGLYITEQVLAEHVKYLKQQLRDVLVTEGFTLQMTATLFNKSGEVDLPLPGYNTVKTPTYYDPYAFNLALVKQQIDKLNDLHNIARQINTQGLASVFNATKAAFLKDVKKEVKKFVDDRLAELNEMDWATLNTINNNADVTQFKSDLNTAKTQLERIVAHLNELVNTYSTPSSEANAAATLEAFTKDLEDLVDEISEFAKTVDSIAGFIKNKLPALITQGFANLNTDLNALKSWALATFENKLLNPLQNKLIETGFIRTQGGTANFTDEVLSHTLESLPNATQLDLVNSGYREHGDYVKLEMRAISQNGSIKTIISNTFTLIKSKGYVDVQATLGFVSQIENKEFDSQWGAAPAISIIYKFPSHRKSYAYRKFFDFGIGLNIATLNFKQENLMEVGAGIVLTGFNVTDEWRNIVTAGFGYNFIAGKPYAIVGFNLPFLSYSTGSTQ